MNIRNLLVGAALFLGLAPVTLAQNPYSNWVYSASLHILTTPAGANLPASASETNFPVLVRLNADLFNFSQARSDGSDIRFASTNGTPLAYEIEQWDPVNRLAAIWVLIPGIQGNAVQPFNMYWGNSSAASQSNGRAVFSPTNGYYCVMHMNGNVLDSTGATSPANNGATATTALIGSSAWALASGGIHATAITNFPTGNNPSSGEVWLRARTLAGDGSAIMGWGNPNDYGWGMYNLMIGFWHNTAILPCPLRCWGHTQVDGTTPILPQQWYHVVYTYTNGTGKVYVNGVLDGSATGSSLSITNTTGLRFYQADVDVDEARISSVVRSTNWIRMEYLNQNPFQTLVGCLVPTGTNFSLSPAAVTMNENTTTNFTAQAGGAQKIYWVLKQNGQETVVAVDRLNYTYAPGRISATLSNLLECQAVYPTGVQTNVIPVTVLHNIPNPICTLSPSTNCWDGRQTFTVTPIISNLADLQAAGVTNLHYQWTVDGVAVTGQSMPDLYSPGVFTNSILTLLRSQGNGLMTVTLVLDNGGALVTNSCAITVQQPATAPWVARTPGTNEVPVNNQFYARDNTGYGTIYYNGSLGGSPDFVVLNVYASGALYTNLSQALSGGKYAFAARIQGGLVNYSVQFGSVTGGVTNFLNTATNLVCGDAYIIDGQSNAEATAPGSETNYWPSIYSNLWIRSYGNLDAGGTTNGGWGYATRADREPKIGYWGMDLASNLWATYNMPICIINGAVGGTMLIQHQANPANHSAPNARGDTIYANLLSRVTAAKLTHGIRGVIWHQGEQDQGIQAGLACGYDYVVYQKHFVNLTAAWKQDFPNIQNYYLFQIWPAACGDQSSDDMLREVQRTLPRLYSNLRIMSTLGIVPGSGCHYVPEGYQRFSDLMAPLLKQDNYGYVPATDSTAPDVLQAYYTTTNKNEIALVFGQNMTWGSTALNRFFLDYVNSANPGAYGKVVSGSASGRIVTLRLSGPSNYQTITYLVGSTWDYPKAWDGVQSNLLYGSNGIAALTFCSVPIQPSASGTIATLPASGVRAASAVLNATLGGYGTNLDVYACWGTTNGGTNAAQWANSAYVGAWTNVASTNISCTATGLAPNTTYYFTFRAANGASSVWAANVLSFTTLGPPLVDNGAGASNLAPGGAQLRGTLSNGPADVRFFWGAADGGTNPAAWTGSALVTGAANGPLSVNVSNLFYGVAYYYRACASNQWGVAWSPATASFAPLKPTAPTAALIPYSSLVEVAASSQYSGYSAVNAFNGAGLQADGTHTTSGNWFSSGASAVSNEWLKVRFDQSYTLDHLRVWAFNAGSVSPSVTNADVYVLDSATDPAGNVNLGGGPFKTNGWSLLLPRQYFRPSSSATTETNTDPSLSLGGVKAQQLALKLNHVVSGTYAGFAEVQVYQSPPVLTLNNLAPSGVDSASATLNATLGCTSAVYQVYAYWNMVNGGGDATLWTNSAYVGSWTNVVSTNLSYTVTGLLPNTPYYFTFCAANAVDTLWAANVQSFTTSAQTTPPVPVLPLSGVTITNGVPTFTFTAAAGCRYRLDCKHALTDAVWSYGFWSTNTTGADLPLTFADSSAAGQPQRFYRLEVSYP